MPTSSKMRTVGRIAAVDNAIIALLMGLNLLLEPAHHFSSHVWDGPKALFHSVRPYGFAFIVLAVALVVTSQFLGRGFYKWALYALAVLYGVLCVSFAPAGAHPDSSYMTAILCLLGAMSVFHTLLSLDPRSRSTQ